MSRRAKPLPDCECMVSKKPSERSTDRDIVLIPSPDGARFRCSLCVPHEGGTYMLKSSIPGHLKGGSHQKCVDEHARRQARIQNLREQLEKNSEEARERPASLASLSAPKPLPARAAAMSAAEERMWEDFDIDPYKARLDAGENIEAALIAEERHFLQQLDNFELWDAQAASRRLGFGLEDELPPRERERDQDDFLADVLQDLCEYFRLTFGPTTTTSRSGSDCMGLSLSELMLRLSQV